MIKRTLRRTLSIVLTLVLIATTFFIFDPSTLKIDADALIGVEKNPGLASITTPQAVAPETIYLKPGSNTFQYFSNINVTEGVAGGSKDATGTVSYKDQASTDTKIYVNNLWHKTGADTFENFAISNLQLGITGGVGAQQNITLAGVTTSNYNVASGATVIGRGSNSATAILNTSSILNNTVRGDVYMIEWVAVSTIAGTKHFTFMYTGIYVPLLTITGATARGKHTTALTNVPKAAGFGFVTGAMAYAEKGNRTTAYTGATAGANCAPLIKFVGQQNNGSDYTIPNCDNGHSSTTSFPDSTPKTIMVVPNEYNANPNGNNYDVWTTYSSWGSYSNPNPTGTNHNDVSEHGGQTNANVYAGVAYEVVDTSRFTDFSQIPNLSAGFIRYYHDRGGDDCSLAWIRCSDAPNADAPTNGVGCVGVDSSDHDDDEDKWRSRTYGLYSFGGATPTTSKGMYVMFRYNQDITTYNYPIQLNIGVGLHITSVNKDAQRKGYCAMLTSCVDNVYDSSFSTTYANMKKQACRLCDPTCTDAGTVSGCTKSEIESKSQTIISSNSGSLYFRVPETIYITPSSNAFEYYVNNAAGETLSPDANAEATSGTFYFNYKGASKVTALTVESVSGAGLSSMTLGGQSLSGGKINIASVSGASTALINTTITAGSLSSHSDAKLKWTLYYVDAATNTTQSVVAYTYCHVPLANASGNNSNSVISVTVSPNYEAAFHTNTYVCGTAWAAGLHSVDSSGTGSDGNGSYKRNWLYNRSQAVPTNGNKNVSDVYNSGTGGSGYWSTNDNVSNVVGGTGTLYVDSSRYTDVGQIPDFYVGIDCNNADSKTRALYVSTGWSTDSQTIVGGDASTNRSEGWSSGGVHPSAAITRGTTTDQTLYIQQWCRSWPDSTRTGTGWCYVNIHYRNKANLRTAYDYYLQMAPVINANYYKDGYYSNLMSYLDTVTSYLCNPKNTTAQGTMDTAAVNLYNQVAMMMSAVTNTQNGTATDTQYKYDGWDNSASGTTVQNQARSSVINSSTAYNYHYNTRTNALITGQGTNPETISYFYGDTVLADKNNYTGYQFKYAEVTKPFDGAALVSALAAKGETTNGKGTVSWNASTRTLSFASVNDTDNYNNYPGPGGDISSYYYIPVIPNTAVTLSYTATGSTAQSFAFFAGSDMKTLPSSGTWLMSNYTTGNVSYTATVPADCYYLTFRFGNQTANSTTSFSNIKMTFKTAVPDEVNSAAGADITWKMYYDPTCTTVKYNPNGGSFNGTTAESTTQVYYDETYSVGKIGTSSPAAPTKTGFSFGGWVCSEDGVAYYPESYDNKPAEAPSGKDITWKYDKSEVTYEALWNPAKYNIAFNGNGNTGGGPMTTIEGILFEETVTLPTNTYTKDGNDFAGWKIGNSGSTIADGAQVTAATLGNPVDGATVTLYAQWTPKTYTINVYAMTENANDANFTQSTEGGTVSGGGTKTYNTELNLSKTANGGFIADSNWYTSSALSTTVTPGNVTANANYYAKFTRERYTINFMRNYDSSDSTVVTTLNTVKYGSTQSVADPTRTGYTFGGWYKEGLANLAYNAGGSFAIIDHGTNNQTYNVYAKWDVNTITVAYEAGGGSGTNPGSHTFNYGSSVTPKANTFTAPAAKVVTFNANGGECSTASLSSTYTFRKWKSSANNAEYAASTATNDSFGATSGTVTLTAQWTQSSITLPTPTRTGYTFNGWYSAASGGTQIGIAGSTYTPDVTKIIYAQWSIGTYTITLVPYSNTIANRTTWANNTNGGTVTGSGSSFKFGDPVSGLSASAKTGYTFVGWYTKAPTGGTTWDETAKVTALPTTMPGEHKTYYARFDVINCEIVAKAYSNTASATTTWSNNTTGGTVTASGAVSGTAGATSTAVIGSGDSATLTATPATGYTFAGWYSSAPTSSSTGGATGNKTVAYTAGGATWYAKFDINQSSLVIKPNDGKWNGSTSTQTITQAKGTTLEVPVPTRTGYTFTSWTKSATFHGTLSSTTADATYTFPDDNGVSSTITANWSPINYTIFYVLDDEKDPRASHGTNHPASAAYDTAFAVSAPTRTGYTFMGWTVTAGLDTATAKWGTASTAVSISLTSTTTKCVNGTSDVYFKNLNSTSGGSVTLTANWKINEYTVKLHAMTEGEGGVFTESTTGGTVSGGTAEGTTYSHGDALSISATAKTGYTFAGWYSNSAMTTAVSSVPTTATANIEYWAKFTLNSYEVGAKAIANTAAATGTFSEANASNAGCSASASAASVKYNNTVTLTATAGTGYTFAGWYDNAAGTGTVLSTSATYSPAITANKTFYAKFTVKTSTVNVYAYSNATGSYEQNTTGGTVKVEGVSPVISAAQSITMGYKGSYKVTATPATGYTFDGWFTNTALTTAATGATASDTYTATFTKKDAAENLYAKFTITTPKLTVYAYTSSGFGNTISYANNATGGTVKINSGTAGASATADINYNSTATMTATAATGYTFDGWFKTVSGGVLSNAYASNTSEAMTEARTYYAKFTAKSLEITFNANGGTNGSNTKMTLYYNMGTATLNGNPTKNGSMLAGWSTSSTATTPTYTASQTLTAEQVNTLITSNSSGLTLYAIWQDITYQTPVFVAHNTKENTEKYVVNAAGDTTGGTAVLNLSGSDTFIKTGDTIEDKITVTPATGYKLVEIRYAVDSVPGADSDVSGWGGTYNTTSTPVMPQFEDGDTVVFIAYFSVETYSIKAYAMSNTTTSNTYTNSAAGGTVKLSTAATGGAEATANNIAFGNSATFVAAPATGYTFDGWYTDSALTQPDTTNASVTVAATASTISNLNRYAKFSIATYNAYARAEYYNEGIDTATEENRYYGITGGTVKVSTESNSTGATTNGIDAVSVSAKYTEVVTYEATPSTGYDFIGWYFCVVTEDHEETDDYADIETEMAIEEESEFSFEMPDGDVRLHAKFVPYNFIIVLNANGGVQGATAEVTATYNKGITLDSTAKPTRSGFSFLGWAEVSSTEAAEDLTEADYGHTGTECSIPAADVNRWFNVCFDTETETGSYTIYAVWDTAKFIVTLNNQGGTGGQTQVEVTLNEPMPTLESLPTYEGYKFGGYYFQSGGEGDKYYNADGASEKSWDVSGNGTLYAKWTCPVLKNASYDGEKWTYEYETDSGTTTVDSTATTIDNIEGFTKQTLTDLAPAGAKEITSIDKTIAKNVEDKNKETADIDLNDYTQASLSKLLELVTGTNSEQKLQGKSQPELNLHIAKVSYYLTLAIEDNNKITETFTPTIKLYETDSKVSSVRLNTLTDEDSATGAKYTKPGSSKASSFVYTNKWCEDTGKTADYYIYTNSMTPVIALEIDDGEVGTSVNNNTASYPTKATVEAEYDDKKVAKTAASDNETYMESAVPASDDITNAWFTPYVKAGIGVGNGTEQSKKDHDYNAKKIVYLTPTFLSKDVEVNNEILYTITPSDDAYNENSGLTKAEIANTSVETSNFASLKPSNQPHTEEGEPPIDSITVCVCYHNSMNGTSDEGSLSGAGTYLQMKLDQIDSEDGHYSDTWLNQMHLFRTSGGATNWELPQTNEEVYPVVDPTYADTGYVMGSFAYIFDGTNEPEATSYAEAGDYAAAKAAIIKSVKATPSEKYAALRDYGHAEHFKNGLGLLEITIWNQNFYPKQGSYVYVHLIDRWGNYFNKVWKCFNCEDIKTGISGTVSSGFTLNEDGGSHLATIDLSDTDVEFITDLDSSYENGVFVTSGNTFTISTGQPASKIPMVVLDHAGNKVSGKIPTDLDGNIKFTVTDPTVDLRSGGYTFLLNGKEVKLYACDPALIRTESVQSMAIKGQTCKFTITTLDSAAKVQLVENSVTRTYTEGKEGLTVVDNGDGTKTWTIEISNLSLGEHTFEVKAKDNTGVWHDDEFTLTTNVIDTPAPEETAVVSVDNAKAFVNEKAVLRITTAAGTDAVRVVYDTGYSTTIQRSDDLVVSSVDDLEVWRVTAGAIGKSGEYGASVYVQYNGVWQKKNIVTCTITVADKVKEEASILAVNIIDKEINCGDRARIEVLTNSATEKLQFVLPTTTTTVTADNAEVRVNGDGTKTWIITKAYKTIGENEVILKSKSAAGWTEAETYGTVNVVK